jgi:hypothetical protein
LFGRVPRQFRRTDARSGKAAILVLGMHRSGTSSIAGSLIRLGGAAPLHLMPAQWDNERGFWESSVISDLNDEILAAGGSDWQDWRNFDFKRIDDAVVTGLRARARSALLAEFDDARLPVIKDPRMCRLMPFWSSVFREMDWSVRALLPVRSPLEVALSLNRRDGIALSRGSLMWLRHALEAEAGTREMPRAFLNWRDFLADPRRSLARVGASLNLAWPRWGERALMEIDEYVSEDLWRQRASLTQLRAHPAVNDLVCEVYGAMLELVRGANNHGAQRRLDGFRARFENGAGIFDNHVRELQDELRQLKSTAAAGRVELLTTRAVASA